MAVKLKETKGNSGVRICGVPRAKMEGNGLIVLGHGLHT